MHRARRSEALDVFALRRGSDGVRLSCCAFSSRVFCDEYWLCRSRLFLRALGLHSDVHLSRRLQRIQAATLRRFYVARFARIYPLHIVALLIALVGFTIVGTDVETWNVDWTQRVAQVALQIALVQSWIPLKSIFFGANGVSWSISVEVLFYALFPLLTLLVSRTIGVLPCRGILIVAASLWLLLLATLLPQQSFRDDWRFYIFPLARLPDFVVGMLLGLAFLRRKHFSVPLRPTSMEMLVVGLIPPMMLVGAILPTSLHFSAWMMPWFSAAILVFADGRGALSRILSNPFAVRLGEASFAFYLIHHTLVRVSKHFLFSISVPLSIAIALLLSVMASRLLFVFVETPARRWIRRPFDSRETTLLGLLPNNLT